MRTRPVQKGFTLIELAVVIAIIAILAAVAIPRFADSTTTAERAMAKDMVSQLTSAAAIYTAENATTPNGFTDFVEVANAAPTSPRTISLANFGPKAPTSKCSVNATTINCTAAFNKLTTVTYTWSGGTVTSTIAP